MRRGKNDYAYAISMYRKATQEQVEGVPRHAEDEGCIQGQEEMSGLSRGVVYYGSGESWMLLLVVYMPRLR